MRVQPSELMKIALVVALARYFNGKTLEEMGKVTSLILPTAMVFLPALLILEQPDLGTSIMVVAVGGIVFFCAGVRWWKITLVLTAIAGVIPLIWPFLKEYQKNRVMTFLNPENDPLGTGYHIIQSKIALGSGGLFGKGFTQGTQSQLSFLPETQTDFIFALIAEEWGLFGALLILILYSITIFYCLYISIRCRNQFGRLMAIGFSANLFLYVFTNMSMVAGMLPVVGVPLPLISWGGTVMIATMMSMGFVMNAYIFRRVVLSHHNDH
jgi:rod shape determining protein RodA